MICTGFLNPKIIGPIDSCNDNHRTVFLVRRISLDHENAKYIEGKVGPTQIVIITDYVKKMSEKE